MQSFHFICRWCDISWYQLYYFVTRAQHYPQFGWKIRSVIVVVPQATTLSAIGVSSSRASTPSIVSSVIFFSRAFFFIPMSEHDPICALSSASLNCAVSKVFLPYESSLFYLTPVICPFITELSSPSQSLLCLVVFLPPVPLSFTADAVIFPWSKHRWFLSIPFRFPYTYHMFHK